MKSYRRKKKLTNGVLKILNIEKAKHLKHFKMSKISGHQKISKLQQRSNCSNPHPLHTNVWIRNLDNEKRRRKQIVSFWNDTSKENNGFKLVRQNQKHHHQGNARFEIWHHWKNLPQTAAILWTCYENQTSKTSIHTPNTQWYCAWWKTKRKASKEVVRFYKDGIKLLNISSLAKASRMAQISEEVVQRMASLNFVEAEAINQTN